MSAHYQPMFIFADECTGLNIHTAHAVNDDQKVVSIVFDPISVALHAVPASDSPDTSIKPRSQAIGGSDDSLEAGLVARKLPVHLKTWHHYEPHVVSILARCHLSQWLRPLTTKR